MANRKTTENMERDEARVDGKAGGAGVGGVAGAAIGAAVGGPVGAGVGAVIGAAAGGAAGAAYDYSDHEPEFREHYESGPYQSITTWEDAGPAYRYGFESAGSDEYQGRTYDTTRNDLQKGWKSKSKYDDMEPLVRHGYERRMALTQGTATGTKGAARTGSVEGQAVVPVVEEELHVGKRKVEKGGVRVETHVTETPVEEQVNLHSEHVEVERRPVNRPASQADAAAAMKECSIEVHESAEEAVVAKQARVIEEVVIRKEASDRTQTVRDTVKRTDVEVKEIDAPAFESLEKDYQTYHGESQARSGYSYEQSTPAYKYGYSLGRDSRYATDWTTTEPEARTMWEERNPGTWEEFKDAVRRGWESVSGKR